jgi:hypothetical protein
VVQRKACVGWSELVMREQLKWYDKKADNQLALDRRAWLRLNGRLCTACSAQTCREVREGPLPASKSRRPAFQSGLYFLPHQSNMPPMRPPVSNAFFCFASRLS